MPPTTQRALVILSATGFLLSGCAKTEKPAPEASANTLATPGARESQAAPVAQPVAAAPAAREQPAPKKAAAANPELVGAVHAFMTQQLRVFIQQKGRMPQNFTEFAGTRMDSVPRPPPGFRWGIDNQTVEVKLVRE